MARPRKTAVPTAAPAAAPLDTSVLEGLIGYNARRASIAIGAMFSLPVFLLPIAKETGWSVTGVSTAMTIGFLAMAFASMGWGGLSDRWGPRPVVLAGSVPYLPDAWPQRLAVGGRLVAIVGEAPVMTLRLVTRRSETAFTTEDLVETAAKALVGFPRKSQFSF